MTIEKIELEDAKVSKKLAELVKANAELAPLMRNVKEFLRDKVEENFASEGRPKWEPLKPSTIKQRGNSGPILQRSGQLAMSMVAESDSTSATVGTNKIYGPTHQFGAKKGEFSSKAGKKGGTINIPWGDIHAREFLAITEGDHGELLELAIDYEKNSGFAS